MYTTVDVRRIGEIGMRLIQNSDQAALHNIKNSRIFDNMYLDQHLPCLLKAYGGC